MEVARYPWRENRARAAFSTFFVDASDFCAWVFRFANEPLRFQIRNERSVFFGNCREVEGGCQPDARRGEALPAGEAYNGGREVSSYATPHPDRRLLRR